MNADNLKNEVNKLADKSRAKNLSRFFKTGKGEYGEGDIFIGLTVPQIRIIAKQYKDLPLTELQKILDSKIHEYRLTALLILTYQYPKAGEDAKKKIIAFYLKNTKYINNWDLVDLSAHQILGNYYLTNSKNNMLFKLAESEILWEKRIAIISTFEFIRNNKFDDSLKIAEILLNDKHDLIHKAVGWMLREIGKRDFETEKRFLLLHYKKMPRTMLRYAIERFDKPTRDFFLKKEYNTNPNEKL
jgi:3-methyladenine DNA glycosylase AlkD